MRFKEILEGYKVLPAIDMDRYPDRSQQGLEGPFRTNAGHVVYYDPREGRYYDPNTDMYLSHDEWEEMNRDRTGFREQELQVTSVAGNKVKAGDGVEIDLDKVDVETDPTNNKTTIKPKTTTGGQNPKTAIKPGTKITIGEK